MRDPWARGSTSSWVLTLALGCSASSPGRERADTAFDPADSSASATGDSGDGSGGEDEPPRGDDDGPGDDDPGFAIDCSTFAERFAQARDALASELAAKSIPGASFAAACGGEVLSAGVGVVRNGSAPVTATTRFQIASVTKPLTAAAALELADLGMLDLYAPVSTWMPTLAYGTDVTMHHLLTHTSGLETMFYDWTADALTPSVLANANMARWAPPGVVWNYNNYAYASAGAVLEAAASRSFADLMDMHVFAPLGMQHATMRVSDVLAGDYAYGHDGHPGSPSVLGPNDSYYGAGWYGPMGGAWATADDLVRFGVALATRPALADQWTSRTRTAQGPAQHHGYGLFLETGVSPLLVHHSGGVEGFSTMLEMVPELGVAAAVIVNADWDVPSAGLEIVGELVDLGPGDAGAPPTDASRLLGTYTSAVFGTIEVRLEGAALEAHFVTKGYASALTPWGHDTYGVEWVEETYGPIPMTFWSEAGGSAEYIVSPWGIARRE